MSKTKYQTLFNNGSTIASVIAAEKLAPVKYITQEAAIIGTETHKLIENHINEVRQTDEVRLLSVAHFNNLIPFLQKINDVHGTELRLYSNKMKLAGTSDCIASYDG